MYPNAKGSETVAILATLDPVNQAVGTVTTGWVPVINFHALMAVIQTGVLGASATVDAKFQQALDNTGTGVKDIPGKSLIQMTQAASGSNRQALINVKSEDFDITGGFGWARLSLSVGVSASLLAAQIWGVAPRFAPADAFDQTAVAQII